MIASTLLNFLFPPLCLSCGEKCSTKSLCPTCWMACAPPDPVERCRHCFEVLEGSGDLCRVCLKNRSFPMTRGYVFDPESPAPLLGVEAVDALAGFAIIQWIQLEWPVPDAVIPMPGAREISLAFAKHLGIPHVQALSYLYEYKEDRLEEDQNLLVVDISSPLPLLQKAGMALSASFPKRMYLLSLY